MPRWITARRLDWTLIALGVALGVWSEGISAPTLGWIGGGLFALGLVGLSDYHASWARFRVRLKHPAWFEDWDCPEDAIYDREPIPDAEFFGPSFDSKREQGQ